LGASTQALVRGRAEDVEPRPPAKQGLSSPPLEKVAKLLRNPEVFFARYADRSLFAVVAAIPEPVAAVHVIEDRPGICRVLGVAGVEVVILFDDSAVTVAGES
jgi:hypothetical protein